MKSVNDECPNITYVYTLGRSYKGREIIAMVISGNPREHEIGRNSFHTTKKPADKTFHSVVKHADKIDRNGPKLECVYTVAKRFSMFLIQAVTKPANSLTV